MTEGKQKAVPVGRVCLRCRSDDHLFRLCPLNKKGDAAATGPRASEAVSAERSEGGKREGGKGAKKEGPRRGGGGGKEKVCGFCYNCGGSHKLANCPKPREEGGKLEFASCFVCGKRGHIASHCSDNPNGIYPKGGACRFCGSKFHLNKDCLKKKQAAETVLRDLTQRGDEGADEMWSAAKPEAKDGGGKSSGRQKRRLSAAREGTPKKFRRSGA